MNLHPTRRHGKLHLQLPIEELYHLQEDPQGKNNIASEHAKLVQEFRQQAITWEKQHGFPETCEGNTFKAYPPPKQIPKENDCRTVNLNTGPWPKRLPASEQDTVETFAQAFTQAIGKETTLAPEKLSIDIYNQALEKSHPLSHASETLDNTPWASNQ